MSYSYLSYLEPKSAEQIRAWLKETLASEYPLLSTRDGDERSARTIARVYKKDMSGHVRTAIFLSCVELARQFLSNPQDGSDDYAEELMILADELRIDVYEQASQLLESDAFLPLSRAKQVAVLSIVRKQPHEYTFWTALDRRTDGKLRSVISYRVLDGRLAEFIHFMPQIADVPVDADLLMILLQMRINGRRPEEKAKLLQLIREVLPQCCASIRRAVAEWFQEERIPGANVDGSHVSMAAGMGAMCGADDDKPVYDGSVSLSYADGREIGCAKCRELFVADVKRKPPTYPTPKGTST
jgi:hypothetical protein